MEVECVSKIINFGEKEEPFGTNNGDLVVNVSFVYMKEKKNEGCRWWGFSVLFCFAFFFR